MKTDVRNEPQSRANELRNRVRELALHNPIVAAALWVHQRRGVSWEDALAYAVVELVAHNDALAAIIEARSRLEAPPLILVAAEQARELGLEEASDDAG